MPSFPLAGIGLRQPHYAPFTRHEVDTGFVEVHSENFFGEGGAALAVLDKVRERYPVSLHGVGLSLGSAAGLDEAHLQQLGRLVRRIDPVRVSDHACFALGVGPQGSRVHAADLLPVPFSREALETMADNIDHVQQVLARPILVENLSACLNWLDADMDEPEFLLALARRTGCGLLLDVNNLFVNALNMQKTGHEADPLACCKAWVERLPVGVVGEVHLAGHSRLQDIVIDDHASRVSAEVWALYQHTVERLGPLPSLIEWDTDVPALEVLLNEAAEAARRMGAVL
jgi:uncharacterized protein